MDPARDPLLEFSSPHLDDLDSVGTSTGSRLVHNEAQHRRRVQTVTGHGTKGEASSTTMNRSRSINRPTHTRGVQQGDDSDEWSDSSAREDSESSAENSDNFDDSMQPSPPFQLLLVSSRFADAAVQSLWRNLVFHGQDSYQMQSLLATLSLEDGLEELPLKLDRHSPGLEKLKEVEEGNVEASAAVGRGGEQAVETHDVSERQQRYAAAGPYVQSGSKYHSPGPGRDYGGGFLVDRAKSHRAAPSSPRWPYRRYVRRVVLNFAHPQASPEMLVNVLECLQSRCPDQIQALDLHANEKMRGAGLEEPEKLKRLFGSGFSKLRYLRLQGGFVDNQLLCALIKSLNSPEPTSSSSPSSGRSSLDTSGNHHDAFAEVPAPPLRAIAPCCLSQVFLGPGSITDSAIEKLVAAAGHSLEVFTVTSCVDVGGRALAELLTKCSKLRVLAVHRSLARDKDLLEGLGIEVEVTPSSTAQSPEMNITTTLNSTLIDGNSNGSGRGSAPKIVRKQIVAPLERLELGMVKLTKVGVSEILKGTCNTLRFLVLETQHFNEELVTDVITPLCTRLEGLYFDDPETLQRQQHQMQGLGFSAGRRGSHLPDRHFEFGRSKRTFFSDPNRQYQQVSAHLQQQRQHQQQLFGIDDRQSHMLGVESLERQHSTQPTPLSAKISAWLGETSTEEWITYGDCALWISAASPSVSFENGAKNPSNHGQGGNQHHPRRQPLPLHHAYHNPAIMSTLMRSDGSGRVTEFNPLMSSFMGEYEDVLERFWMRRETVENVLHSLKRLGAFTVMQMDLIMENRGLSEWKTMMRQDELWVQSTGFRALQLFYLCLFLSMIYFGTFRW
ncbi:hypothetical protein BGZ99_004813 [Dissophora globulifera]|uniref:Uncharacterized protein n=1 Tax=Dissophora globulifera TaxID=979702 RepID=A0A9P6UUC7_9FUNG|nr:hypothetical protein BGZ99_004813 [Dissophora globulifera]